VGRRAVTPGRILIATVVAALAVFAFVQDRGVAAGAGRYVRLQRAAQEERRPPVTVDEVMGPAVGRSVRLALLWSGGVLIAGVAAAMVCARLRPLGPGAAASRGRAGR
jgi:hypothetical protein